MPLRLQRAAIAAALILAGSAAAEAHPHVWVTASSKVIYDRDAVAAVEHSWTFDEFYSTMAVQGLDKNNDGQYSREELAELAQINMEGLKEFDYFTAGRRGAEKLEFAAPVNAYLDYTGGILTLNFRLPLKEPAASKDFSFATFDPAFFIAFELAKDYPVTLAGAPPTCSIALRDDEQAASPQAPDANQTLAGAFSQQFGGASVLTTKWASIQCKNS